MKGAGSDEKTMVRIICGQRDTHLKAIAAHFLEKYEKGLIGWVKGEVRGDFENALVSVIEANQ